MKNIKIIMGLFVLSVFPSLVAAQVWSPQLLQGKQDEFRKPTEIFQIKLPAKVSARIISTLALELDNIDVTALIKMKGKVLTFTPVKELEWGKHVLRLVEYTNEGDINEKGYWNITVRDTTLFKKTDYSADVSLSFNQRVVDKNISSPDVNRLIGQGNAGLQMLATNPEWEVTGNTQLIYNSENKDAIELGDYLFTAKGRSSFINLGQHGITNNNFIMENFNSRGISARKNVEFIKGSATGFIMRSEQITGSKYPLGISDSKNTTQGLFFETQPLTKKEKLYISATYLTGKSDKVGETIGVEKADRKTEAWSIVADSSLLKQKLRLRAEFASSVNNIITADLTDTDLINAQGEAVSLFATYSPQPKEEEKNPYLWSAGLELSKVDTLFNSIANPNLPNDKLLSRVFYNSSKSGFNTQLLIAKETDNVGNDAARPVIETGINQLSLNYSSTEEPKKDSLLGAASYSLIYAGIKRDQIKAANTLVDDTDIYNNSYMLAANFNKEKINWGWSYTLNKLVDNIYNLNSSITGVHQVNINHQYSESLSISHNISMQTSKVDLDGVISNNNTYNLGLQHKFTEKLMGALNFGYTNTLNNSIISPEDTTTITTGFQLNWNWIAAKTNKPGIDISLQGNYQDVKNQNDPLNNLESYQVFLGLTMTAPLTTVK